MSFESLYLSLSSATDFEQRVGLYSWRKIGCIRPNTSPFRAREPRQWSVKCFVHMSPILSLLAYMESTVLSARITHQKAVPDPCVFTTKQHNN
jgi:hypothetical protein